MISKRSTLLTGVIFTNVSSGTQKCLHFLSSIDKFHVLRQVVHFLNYLVILFTPSDNCFIILSQALMPGRVNTFMLHHLSRSVEFVQRLATSCSRSFIIL